MERFQPAPVLSLSYGLAMVAVSYMLVLGLSSIGLFYLVLPMVAGFMLVGPIVACRPLRSQPPAQYGPGSRLSDAFGPSAVTLARSPPSGWC